MIHTALNITKPLREANLHLATFLIQRTWLLLRSYCIGETLLITIFTHYGNLIEVPEESCTCC